MYGEGQIKRHPFKEYPLEGNDILQNVLPYYTKEMERIKWKIISL